MKSGIWMGILAFSFLFLPMTHAFVDASLYSVTLEIGKSTVHETVLVELFTTEEKEISLKLTADPENLVAMVNGNPDLCAIKNEVGSSLLTCRLGYAGQHTISAEYDTSYSLVEINGRKIIRHNHVPNFNSDVFRLSIKLPSGGVVEHIETDVVPRPDEITSDGKRIILSWERNSLLVPFGVSVIFDSFERTYGLWYFFGILILALGAIIFLLRKKLYAKFMDVFGKAPRSASSSIVYPDLLESEQKVVDALKTNLNVLKQKDIVNVTGFSKAKVSRLLKQMEARKLIYTTPFGNSRKIHLVTTRKRV